MNQPSVVKDAIVVASLSILVAGILVSSELRYLAPYNREIFGRYYGWVIAYMVMVAVNSVAPGIWLIRKLRLHEYGGHLEHAENELRSGRTPFSEEFLAEHRQAE